MNTVAEPHGFARPPQNGDRLRVDGKEVSADVANSDGRIPSSLRPKGAFCIGGDAQERNPLDFVLQV